MINKDKIKTGVIAFDKTMHLPWCDDGIWLVWSNINLQLVSFAHKPTTKLKLCYILLELL